MGAQRIPRKDMKLAAAWPGKATAGSSFSGPEAAAAWPRSRSGEPGFAGAVKLEIGTKSLQPRQNAPKSNLKFLPRLWFGPRVFLKKCILPLYDDV